MPLGAILGGLGKSIVDGVSGWANRRAERKAVQAKGKIEIQQAKIAFKVAKWQSRERQVLAKEENDASYDMQVLRNRDKTWADELIIIVFYAIFLMHFIPVTQPYMLEGWEALKDVPWWFQFIMIGIAVSTLGLMRLFRLFWTRRTEKQAAKPEPAALPLNPAVTNP